MIEAVEVMGNFNMYSLKESIDRMRDLLSSDPLPTGQEVVYRGFVGDDEGIITMKRLAIDFDNSGERQFLFNLFKIVEELFYTDRERTAANLLLSVMEQSDE